MEYKKKLIEVALPLEAINAASAREKSIRHGHPSTLHLWWARRPLAAARAVIFSSLVNDPSSMPEEFPTEEEQAAERQRLFGILERLVLWENTNNPKVLAEAKAEIMKSTDGNPPALLDPFAGGGTIPLEAQRLGLQAYASDLNPVAVMINKAMIEIPPRFAGQPPVNPDASARHDTWPGASGLAEDVRYYGEWMKQKAFERIGHLYPKVKDAQGQEHTVIAWLWARTVKCPNPACGCEMPLVTSFALSKKKGKEAFVQPIIEGTSIRYEVRQGTGSPKGTIIRRKGASCFCCGNPTDFEYIREEGRKGRMGVRLLAIVVEGSGGRGFVSADALQLRMSIIDKPDDYPDAELPNNPRDFKTPNYGIGTFAALFTNRQLTALTTLSKLVMEAHDQMVLAGSSVEYADAVCTYLAFAVDRQVNYCSTINTYADGFVTQTFGRQALPMVWNYSETNIFSSSTGNWSGAIEWVVKCFGLFPCEKEGIVNQRDAKIDNGMRGIMISTDPPYYDNIGYADLSDFFYIWMRQALRNIYPDIFATVLVPKTEELIATPYRFEGSAEKAKSFFEDGMKGALEQVCRSAASEIPVTIYYAFKATETDSDSNTSSTGWETMLSAIISSGLSLTATWPMHTERETGLKSAFNALASSIVLVCRKRPEDAPITTRRDFINTLKRELKPALQKLQASNIAPVDLAQSAIGPGMGVYSRFAQVLEADGTPMSVRSALQVINQELDTYFNDQDGELDRDSRFCVDLYTQYGFDDVKFGEADVLARAKNTSIERLHSVGIAYAGRGIVRLLERGEVNPMPNPHAPSIQGGGITWRLTQQLTRALEQDGVVGVAKIIANIFTSEPEQAKALAYRLFQVAERKGWSAEAYAYNSLVIAWPEVQSKAAEIQATANNGKQMDLFDVEGG